MMYRPGMDFFPFLVLLVTSFLHALYVSEPSLSLQHLTEIR